MSPRDEGGTRPTPYQIPRFGGLDLREEPDEGGPQTAIDLLNVDFDRGGAVRVRDGYENMNSVGVSGLLGAAPLGTDGRFVGASSGTIYSWNAVGTLIDSHASTGQVGPVFVAYPDPTTPTIFVFGQTNAMSIKIADGDVDAGIAAGVQGLCGAVQPPDNRLVVVPWGGSALATPTTKVQFSDAGDPTTFGVNNFVNLVQGAGSSAKNVVTWGNQVYVFKEESFAVFYGNSDDADGNPVFNYRMVEGRGTPGLQGAVAGYDGVYFLARDGVYKTTGSRAVKVSAAIDPLFNGTTLPFFNPGGSFVPSFIGAVGDRIYLGDQGDSTLVYDIPTDSWLFWNVAAFGPIVGIPSAAASTLYPCAVTGAFVERIKPTLTTDAGTAIASRYRSSFYSPIGSPSQECTIRESIIDGSGTPSFSVARDYGAVPTTGGGAKTAVTLGTAPAIAQGRHRISQRGRRISYQIEATSGAWRVESIIQHVTGIRSPGLKTT